MAMVVHPRPRLHHCQLARDARFPPLRHTEEKVDVQYFGAIVRHLVDAPLFVAVFVAHVVLVAFGSSDAGAAARLTRPDCNSTCTRRCNTHHARHYLSSYLIGGRTLCHSSRSCEEEQHLWTPLSGPWQSIQQIRWWVD